tara:strand:+ start:268 stop:2142 length:1875 start_codon:yes stop_codon:yes gene_type:complete
MTIEKKLLGTSPSGGATDVADVFSTDLYTGAGGTQTITNGIDLSGEGGLVWVKHRTASNAHMLVDTERGVKRSISSNTTTAQTPANANNVDAFYSTGFQVGPDGSTNQPNGKFVSWTFRKKKKFFDIVTWTGNDTAGRTIPHNLGSVPAMMLVKMTNGTYSWNVYHSGIGATKFLELDTNNGGQTSSAVWNNTAPTDSVFTVGQEYGVNQGSKTYVAYLFADNSSEGADDQMIKCGSFTTDGSGAASVNLGWEPQFLLTKKTNASADWVILDSMRGFPTKGIDNAKLSPNTNGAEAGSSSFGGGTVANGFSWFNDGASQQYIYMAIRAPMMVEPEAATDVFAIDTGSASSTIPTFDAPFAVDFAIKTSPTQASNRGAGARIIQGRAAQTNDADAEVNDVNFKFDSMAGFGTNFGTAFIGYMWKRAKGYMDVVAFNGGGAGATVPHSLGVKPELFVYKRRNAGSEWMTYVSSVGATKAMFLDKEDVPESAVQWFNNTEPTNTVFTTGSKGFSGSTFIAYLFATIAGISKCGSYTGNGSYQTISCGFSAGSRFVLIKRTDAVGDWYVWDSVRGISAGNDPHLSLNTTAAQVNDDSIDPANAGFIVNQVSATNINVSSGTYIFYAIA